jgi:hypothetical protein
MHFPPELFQRTPTAAAVQVGLSLTLLPTNRIPGPSMTMLEFCVLFNIDESIAGSLLKNGYNSTDTFQFTEVVQLQDFLVSGIIAQLRAAVFKWSSAHT